jgi:hypothetical protein
MKLKYFEWSSKMSKTIKSLAVVALLATPTFAAAETAPSSMAASISASFGDSDDSAFAETDAGLSTATNPTSVSVAGSMGSVAIATASATADASNATAVASSDSTLAPTLATKSTDSGYETTVAFTPATASDVDVADIIAEICENGFTAEQASSKGTLLKREIGTGNPNRPSPTPFVVIDPTVDLNLGDISVSCAVPSSVPTS